MEQEVPPKNEGDVQERIEASPWTQPISKLLLTQVSAISLGVIGTTYIIGMMSIAIWATRLGLPPLVAYSYYSPESILTRGLGVIFSIEFLGLLLLLVIAIAVLWNGTGLVVGSNPETETGELRVNKRDVAAFAVIMVGAFLFAPAGLTISLIGFGIYGLLFSKIVDALPRRYLRRGIVVLTAAVLFTVSGIGSYIEGPRLPKATVSYVGEHEPVEEDLWIRTDNTWVFVRDGDLAAVPDRSVEEATISKSPLSIGPSVYHRLRD